MNPQHLHNDKKNLSVSPGRDEYFKSTALFELPSVVFSRDLFQSCDWLEVFKYLPLLSKLWW